MTIVIIIHVIACVVLIGLVLVQRGRGGGLVDSFQGVESMFGPKTNEFLTRTTTILSIVFFISCLTLAFLSVKQSKSLLGSVSSKKAAVKSSVLPANVTAKALPVADKAQDKSAVTAVQEQPKAEAKPVQADAEKTQEKKAE